ncbi:MAG TPA: hypothetical protein VGN34_03245, partial [Ktedonobacteraceae bacterium]
MSINEAGNQLQEASNQDEIERRVLSSQAGPDNSGSVNAQLATTPPVSAARPKEYSALQLGVPEHWTSRRMRLNRMLMRKRFNQRMLGSSLSLQILGSVLALFVISVGTLFGGVGAAYAYYQSQLPLLKGIAQHTLFQTTHIYDRNGHLLKAIYDQRPNYGRRTYVDYNAISPLLVKATVAA